MDSLLPKNNNIFLQICSIMANSDGPRKIEISQKNKVFTLYIIQYNIYKNNTRSLY